MILFKRNRKFQLEDAQKQLREAEEKKQQVEQHTPEVERVANESARHTKGNGFYELFKQGLKGA